MPFFGLQPSSHKRKKAYLIGEHIGSGGYGEVKRATRIEDGEEVAIKIVPKACVTDIDSQIQRQNALLTMGHPHVIKLFEWFESKEKFYLIFELAAGGELYEHLVEESRFGEEEAREVAHALADALNYLHSMNVIHRDLKPENVLYRTPPGHNGFGHDDCVISDFGLAALLSHHDQVLTTHCGSPGYTAPEVYANEGYSIPSDMWSLGVIIFATMGGRFPYKNTEPRALANEARTTTLYFPSSWKTISPLAKDFIKRLLTVDPAKRMTAAQALEHPWFSNPITLSAVPSSLTTPDDSEAGSPRSSRPSMERRTTLCDNVVPISGIAGSGVGNGSTATVNSDGLRPEFSPLEKQSTHTSIRGAL